jgi:hypothetical protein
VGEKEYSIVEVGDEPIGTLDFYKDHVSKSLPLIVRKGCEEWPIRDKVKSDKDLEEMFIATVGETMHNNLSPFLNLSLGDIDKTLASKGGNTTANYV